MNSDLSPFWAGLLLRISMLALSNSVFRMEFGIALVHAIPILFVSEIRACRFLSLSLRLGSLSLLQV